MPERVEWDVLHAGTDEQLGEGVRDSVALERPAQSVGEHQIVAVLPVGTYCGLGGLLTRPLTFERTDSLRRQMDGPATAARLGFGEREAIPRAR